MARSWWLFRRRKFLMMTVVAMVTRCFRPSCGEGASSVAKRKIQFSAHGIVCTLQILYAHWVQDTMDTGPNALYPMVLKSLFMRCGGHPAEVCHHRPGPPLTWDPCLQPTHNHPLTTTLWAWTWAWVPPIHPFIQPPTHPLSRGLARTRTGIESSI